MTNELREKTLIVIFVGFLIFLTVVSLQFFSLLRRDNPIALAQVSVIIPEGYTVKDIADKFKRFKNFNREKFLETAKEGYLFPDTYFLSGRETDADIIEKMEDNFREKTENVKPDILIMASLLEKEAKTEEDKKIISGILWKRLDAGMPLQVDAARDTYSYKGLPLEPICNSGLVSISAAGNPFDSEYWYYLSDKNGIIHYAKNFEEHKKNKAKYLR